MSTPGPEWWGAVSPHLDAALDMSPEERAAWLAALRQQNPSIAGRVEALLVEHAALKQERFLEDAASVLSGRRPTAGMTIGAYTLVAPIGEGGMGTVWLAERTDGEIQRKVAMKLLGAAGRRPAWRQRFLRERQLLASLHHPAVVQAIDAGHTDDGTPYLVMEFVDGAPIDVYANGRSMAERLHLFLRVCDGVAYAHRRLVIHRDLKPSNILVDASGQPKLLDFGIARLLDDSTDRTRTIERVLTPKYASPEQFQGAAQTTATDIYSLGAVLYDLVTGRPPHDGDGTDAEAGESSAGTNRTPPATHVNPALPSDLDFILRKALRPEPDERYASVDAFASDIRALLESRPVEARSGNAWYRARTFIRRYRLVVTAAALVLLSLSGGLYIANRERMTAQRRFNQVRQLANAFIGLDAQLRELPGSTAVRSRIVSESLGYLQGLGREVGGDPELSLEIGNAYRQVGEVQGVPFVANLGEYTAAEESLRNADAFVNTVLQRRPAQRSAWLISAQIHRDWMALVDYQDRRADTLVHAAIAAARLDRFLRLGRPSPDEINSATLIYLNVATAYTNTRRYEDAVAYCRRALAISNGVPAARMRRASAFGGLSVALREGLGDLDGALTAARESRALLEKMAASGGRAEMFNLHVAFVREGSVLGEDAAPSLNRPADAAIAFQRAADIAETLVHKDPNDSAARIGVALALGSVADITRRTDAAKALALYDKARATLREAPPNSRSRFEEANLLSASSYAARALHDEADARRRIDAAFEILRELKAYPQKTIEPGADVYQALKARADDSVETGEPGKAIDTYSELATKMAAFETDTTSSLLDSFVMSNTWEALARLLRSVGRNGEAVALENNRAALWTDWDRRLPHNAFIRQQLTELHR